MIYPVQSSEFTKNFNFRVFHKKTAKKLPKKFNFHLKIDFYEEKKCNLKKGIKPFELKISISIKNVH